MQAASAGICSKISGVKQARSAVQTKCGDGTRLHDPTPVLSGKSCRQFTPFDRFLNRPDLHGESVEPGIPIGANFRPMSPASLNEGNASSDGRGIIGDFQMPIEPTNQRIPLPMSRRQFLLLATSFQGGLAILALVIAWLLNINPLDQVRWTTSAGAAGILGTIPMLLVFAVTYRSNLRPLREVRCFLTETLGPTLKDCYWFDLLWVSFLAGYSEELLFRGVIQNWVTHWGWVTGLIVGNILFAVAHAITPAYVILAAILGMMLGLLFECSDSRNLLVPVVAHTLYDLIALTVIRRNYLRQSPENSA